jgi:hypothetical protein
MATNTFLDGASSLILRRPAITTSGFIVDVDPNIKAHLDELNTLLGKRIFPGDVQPEFLTDVLRRPITPKRVSGDKWAPGSMVQFFNSETEADNLTTLTELIDRNPDLSELKNAFEVKLSKIRLSLEYNTKTVMDDHQAIRDYLVAFGFLVMGLEEVNALKNFVLGHRFGAKDIANYAIVSAARTFIQREHLNVPNANDDNSDIVREINSARLSMSGAKFKTNLSALVKSFISFSEESQILTQAEVVLGKIDPGIKPQLLKLIKNAKPTITQANATFFIPLFISQIQGSPFVDETEETEPEEADREFEVDFLEDDDALIEVSRSAVRCASQLYYSMVLGEELDVFNIVNFFTHKYLVRGSMEILDGRLRDDLQLYVFSNKFTDRQTKRIEDRTRPGERHMFYRQVFNQGQGRITEDVIVNAEFPRLWKVLILESANYIERSQSSFNPGAIPKGKVMQSVEDLQYNLSTHCTGMANVITPLINAELDFVIRRIFMHPEVLRQIVPQGGTWWRVVEKLYMELKHSRPKSTVIYSKAKLGNKIIRAIAEYNPATFEDETEFSSFISDVDAFITTQSILQEALTDSLKKDEEDEEEETAASNGYHTNGNGYPKTMPALATEPAGDRSAKAAAGDEWDF